MVLKLENLIEAVKQEPWAKDAPVEGDFWPLLMSWVEEYFLSRFLEQVTKQIDEIVDIDPDLPEPQILEKAGQYMADFLGAHHASVRIYDPQTQQMLYYGSHSPDDETRETFIPLEGSIAGEVVKSRRPCLVPDILDEERYQNKDVIQRKGVRSLMAVPLEITRFSQSERNTVGVIQIYYADKGRKFTSLEVQMAILMAKRLSFVIARKKIISLNRSGEKKESIVGQIFKRLGNAGE